MTYTMGSLFAGIGGFDLGFERAGFKTSWQVEIDPYCQKVLAKNFPEAERFGNIRECCGIQHDPQIEALVGVPCSFGYHLKPVDVICGGFPCQDISNAGKRAGIEGERSGLWSEYARIIRELRPAYVLVENVAALLGRGMGVVLGDLAEIGYDAEWDVFSAADFGAPHLRERIWILAYPAQPCRIEPQDEANPSADARRGGDGFVGSRENVSDSNIFPVVRSSIARRELSAWSVEPSLGRVVDGVSHRMVEDELRALGNAVVPQIPEMMARGIKQALEATHEAKPVSEGIHG